MCFEVPFTNGSVLSTSKVAVTSSKKDLYLALLFGAYSWNNHKSFLQPKLQEENLTYPSITQSSSQGFVSIPTLTCADIVDTTPSVLIYVTIAIKP